MGEEEIFVRSVQLLQNSFVLFHAVIQCSDKRSLSKGMLSLAYFSKRTFSLRSNRSAKFSPPFAARIKTFFKNYKASGKLSKLFGKRFQVVRVTRTYTALANCSTIWNSPRLLRRSRPRVHLLIFASRGPFVGDVWNWPPSLCPR